MAEESLPQQPIGEVAHCEEGESGRACAFRPLACCFLDLLTPSDREVTVESPIGHEDLAPAQKAHVVSKVHEAPSRYFAHWEDSALRAEDSTAPSPAS